MAELGLPQPEPRVGIRGNPESLPVYKSQETLHAQASIPGFLNAFANLANTTTTLSDLSSQIAINSSQALAKKWGYEAGLNPHGNPIPPITNFDKAYTDSYLSQSENTLSLHANSLLIKGQDELQKAYKLTPDIIQNYTTNMQEGLNEIYQMAPDAIKGGLQLQYQSTLMRSESSLKEKMLSSQRAAASDEAQANYIIQNQQVYESALNGNADVAKTLSESAIVNINKAAAAGIISKSQAATHTIALRNSIITGQKTFEANELRKKSLESQMIGNQITSNKLTTEMIKAEIATKKRELSESFGKIVDSYITDAQKAKDEGEFDNYLTSLIKSKNPNLSNEQWDKIVGRVIKHFQPQSYLQNKEEHEARVLKEEEKTTKEERINRFAEDLTRDTFKSKATEDYEQFMADLPKLKPKDMSNDEWTNVLSQVYKNINEFDTFQKRNENVLYSEGDRLLSEGSLTPNFLHQLETKTTDRARFNEFMVKVANTHKQADAKKAAAAELIPKWTNTDAMALATKTAKNDALVMATNDIVQKAKENGRDISPQQAEVEAMSTVAVPIPAFTEKMNRGFLSGNPQIMLEKLHAYNALNNSNSKVLNNLSDTALAMKTQFELQMEDGQQADVAAERAYNIVSQKTPEQLEINTALTKQWESTKVRTASQLNSWASDIIDELNIPSDAHITNLPSFAIHAKNIYKSNLNFHNGNQDAARTDLVDGLKRAWGVTEVNGKQEFVFQPLESTLDLDSGAVPVIKEDVYNQIHSQIEPMNTIYQDGKAKKDNRLSFYYRMPDRPDFEQYIFAKQLIKEKRDKEPNILISTRGISPALENLEVAPEIAKAYKTVREYEKSELTIERVHDGGQIEKFTIDVKANPGLQIDENTGVIGSYNLSIRSGDGPSSPMVGWFKGPFSEPVYLPQGNNIRRNYSLLKGMNITGLTPQQIHANWKAQKDREALRLTEALGTNIKFGRYNRGIF